MDTIIEEIRKRIKARMDNVNAAGDYDEYADGHVVGLAAALRIIDEVEKEHPFPSDVEEAALLTINGWVARDKCGELYFFKEKPTRGKTIWNTEYFCAFMPFPQRNLPSLRWEDEPREVEIIIKEVWK